MALMKIRQRSVPRETSFWESLEIIDGGCWEWTKCRNNRGYGRVQWEGRARMAHRVAWELICGEIPEGVFVCHSCDNRICCKPDHLFLGTHEDNMADMMAKGRKPRKPYCANGHALVGDNVRINGYDKKGNPTRACRICVNENKRKYWHRDKSL